MRIKNIMLFFMNIINFVILFVIICNLISLIFFKVLKKDYISVLDYAFFVNIENNDLRINKDELLIVDLRASIIDDDLVMYKNEENYNVARVIDQEEEINIYDGKENKKVEENQIIGTIIKKGIYVGPILYWIKNPIVIVTSIILLFPISFLQSLLYKKIKKDLNPKPDFIKKY